MNIPWLDTYTPLPHPESAQKEGSPLAGLVAAGGGLTVQRLCEAYQKGMFPWFSYEQPVLWWSPDPRMVLKTADFKIHRSFQKTLKTFQSKPTCEIRMNTSFEQVIQLCAQVPRAGQAGTWIVNDMIQAYIALHQAGFAHSIETWMNGQLVGGLYCVAMGDALFGESMFAQEKDASKIALAALVAFARSHGISWIDCQQNTRHLASLGAKEVPRSEFLKWVRSVDKEAHRTWTFESNLWNALRPTEATQ
jgi:leucyl/phenylalanyl-tRNA--protein transferase